MRGARVAETIVTCHQLGYRCDLIHRDPPAYDRGFLPGGAARALTEGARVVATLLIYCVTLITVVLSRQCDHGLALRYDGG